MQAELSMTQIQVMAQLFRKTLHFTGVIAFALKSRVILFTVFR